ncbi:SDR family NAD(P)-dependent oxidoreductase [Coprothermobacter platensis]|uniref:SDR family NAD(P)-dependent oxidoreductase n=1 Tax=Coprothermobacter platensis TaxID=108819 RepID=UPI00036E3993|nr:glucose 1-dehydrogenase [Coprothermobacter platensis]
MAGRLEGKVALITGTGTGQGKAAAVLFAKEGAKVVGCGRRENLLEETAQEIAAFGGEYKYLKTDLSKENEVKALIDFVKDTYGKLDILYNNAAHPEFAPSFLELDWEKWSKSMDNELNMVYWSCHYGLPLLIENGGGAVINTSSILALMGGQGLSFAAHSATKGAIISFSRQLAVEYAPHNIRVNVICPGMVEADITKPFIEQPEVVQQWINRHLIKRLGKPEDIAYAALYLASDEASWVTGSVLVVDGGWTAY